MVRDPAVGSFHPEDDRRTLRRPDSASYKGERLEELKAEADAGDANAAYKLGEAYLYGFTRAGRSVPRALDAFDQGAANDPGLAVAGRDHPHVAYNVGMVYLDGTGGTKRDTFKAVPWLTAAANNGVPEAQYNLGLLLYQGDGVQRDLYEALQWFRRGAEGGYLPAQRTVGRIYMTGLDTMGQDLDEARTWLSAAAARGDEKSRRWLAELDASAHAQEEQSRQLQAQEAQTATFLAAALFAAALAPPTYVVVY